MFPVRLVSFEKNEDTNWQVPWHQDRVIAVRDRHDVPGFGNWTQKNGVWHCEPPLSLLQDMLFVRVHLDDSTTTNGAKEIAIGSHRGAVAAAEASHKAATCQQELTLAAAGDVLVLSMLTLHRSRPSQDATPRRVLRVDFARCDLPKPLQWAL